MTEYESHVFVLGQLISSLPDAPEVIRACIGCGCEDLGDPSEFPELNYPMCPCPFKSL